MYHTPETLLNHIFEDLRKPKAPNSGHKDRVSFNPFPLTNGHLDRVSFLLNQTGHLDPSQGPPQLGVLLL
jgi:hypothetical protein